VSGGSRASIQNNVTVEMTSASDEQIAQAAQTGSLRHFEELVRRYEIRINRFVAHRCRDAGDAQEVTQDIFVAAYRGLGRFDVKRPFVTWLFTIARRKCIDYSRSRRRVVDEVLPEEADKNDPCRLLERREAGEDLWRTAQCALPGAQYDALWLRYAEDLEVSEVARVMKLTRTHVKVLLFRARLRLERELRSTANPAHQTNSTLTCSAVPAFRAVSHGGLEL
jgi:RNA polymerase sigma-70 factor (ECF subfamily)